MFFKLIFKTYIWTNFFFFGSFIFLTKKSKWFFTFYLFVFFSLLYWRIDCVWLVQSLLLFSHITTKEMTCISNKMIIFLKYISLPFSISPSLNYGYFLTVCLLCVFCIFNMKAYIMSKYYITLYLISYFPWGGGRLSLCLSLCLSVSLSVWLSVFPSLSLSHS